MADEKGVGDALLAGSPVPAEEGEVVEEEVGEEEAGAEADESTAPESEEEAEGEEEKALDPMAQLTARISELSSEVKALSLAGAATSAAVVEEEKPPERTPIDISDLVTEEQFEEVIGDRTKFVSLMNRVAERVHNQTVEHTTRTIPAIAASEAARTTNILKAVDAFYAAHPDLSGFKGACRTVFNEISTTNPNLGPDVILSKMLAPEVRKRLGLKAAAAVQGKKKPTVAPGGGSRAKSPGGKPSLTKAFEDQINRMGRVGG